MASSTLAGPRVEASSRHLWLVAAFGLLGCACAAGYALALHEIQALYVGLAAVACIAILFDYRIGAILLALLLPISSTAFFPHALMGMTGLNPMNVLLVGTLAAYVLHGRLEHPGPLMPRPVLWLYLVPIVLAGVLGLTHFDDILPAFFDLIIVPFTTPFGYFTVTVMKPLLLVLMALLVGAAVATARKPEGFVVAVAVGACALALLEIGFVIASGIRLGVLASPRGRAFFTELGAHANDLGRVFVTTYALLLFAWWETKHAQARLALFVALAILCFGILFTFSRNAFLGFFVVNALFVVWKFNLKKLGLALLGFAVAIALAPGYVYRRIQYGFDSGSVDTVSAGRVEGLWLSLLPETLKSPLWGSGLDSIMWSEPMVIGAMGFAGHPHNAYLQAMLDMGLIGLGLLLAYYWHVWKGFSALGSNPYLTPFMRGFFQGACAALIAFAVACMSGGSLRPHPDNVVLWLAIGVMYGLLARRPAS